MCTAKMYLAAQDMLELGPGQDHNDDGGTWTSQLFPGYKQHEALASKKWREGGNGFKEDAHAR